jgi:hypothetical protein
MKLKEDNIDIYNNSAVILNDKTPDFINAWLIILVILCLLFIEILFIPFNMYSAYNGHIIESDKESYISLNLEKSDFPISKNNKLYIKDKSYRYKILGIEGNNILISIKLDDIKINNNIVVVNILKNRTTLYKMIKNKMKKGFGL